MIYFKSLDIATELTEPICICKVLTNLPIFKFINCTVPLIYPTTAYWPQLLIVVADTSPPVGSSLLIPFFTSYNPALNPIVPNNSYLPFSLTETEVTGPFRSHVRRHTPDSIIKVWDLETGEIVNKFEGHNDLISSIAFSQNLIKWIYWD